MLLLLLWVILLVVVVVVVSFFAFGCSLACFQMALNKCLHTYIYIYIHIYFYIYIHTYIHKLRQCMCIYIYTPRHLWYIIQYSHTHMHKHTHTSMYTCTRIQTFTQTRSKVHTCIQTHAYTYAYSFLKPSFLVHASATRLAAWWRGNPPQKKSEPCARSWARSTKRKGSQRNSWRPLPSKRLDHGTLDTISSRIGTRSFKPLNPKPCTLALYSAGLQIDSEVGAGQQLGEGSAVHPIADPSLR